MPVGAIFALVAFAGVFLLFVGLSQMRRSAGGSEDFEARLAAYGVTTAGATTLPPATGFRDTLNRLFQPAADRVGRGNVKKGKPSVAEQLNRADLNIRYRWRHRRNSDQAGTSNGDTKGERRDRQILWTHRRFSIAVTAEGWPRCRVVP